MSTDLHDEQTWAAWHAERERDLATPHGWLSLVGLHWLTDAATPLPDLPGRWWFDSEGIWLEPTDAAITLDGAPVTSRTLLSDPAGKPHGDLRYGARQLELFSRGEGNFAVRVRDPQARSRTEFPGVPTFDFAPDWQIEARFEPLPEIEAVPVGSASSRVQHVRRILGHAIFDHDGSEYRLAISGGHAVQIAFRDATNGTETFGLMRQLTVAPTEDGTVLLDFNRAVNPPCSFSDYGTCPLPPPGNVLPFAVTAGEKTQVRTP